MRPVLEGATLRVRARGLPLVLKRSSARKTQLRPEVVTHAVELVDECPPVFRGARHGFSIPLAAGGDLYGALDIGYRSPGHPTDEDEALLIPIANHLSVALRNVRLHAETAFLRDYLGKLIEHADALILGVDRDWRVTVFNQAIARLMGTRPNEVIGSDVRDWLSPSERHRLTRVIAHVLAGRHAAPVDIELSTRAGETVRTVWNVAAIRSDGVIEAVVAVGQDVTRLRSLEEQVIQAEKLATLGQLAAGVVHELNNPLTSIIAYTDYLVKKLDRHAQIETGDVEKLRRILEGAERIMGFSRELVQYGRPSEEDFERLPLNDVVHQGVSFCEHMVQRDDVRLVRDLEEDLPALPAVRSQLLQVIINLITNAVHAVEGSGGTVRIRTYRRSSRHVALLVEDDGVGIPADRRDRIFEPFFTTKEGGKGTGLGLSIVRNIVERHRGTVTVESRNGHGTRFTVVLPL